MKEFTLIYDDSFVYYMGTTEDALKIPYVHDVMEKYFDTYDDMLEFVNKLELDVEN